MLISRKVTEVSEISHVNLRAGWKESTKPINRSLVHQRRIGTIYRFCDKGDYGISIR